MTAPAKNKVKLPSTATGRRRLLKLADLLEANAKNKKGMRFDLSVVAEPADDRIFTDKFPPTLDCGTVGCAIGLACLSGAFKRAGLSYRVREYDILPTFRGEGGFHEAASGVFGLTFNEVDWLFMPGGYQRATPRGANGERLVAKRIRDFVAGKASP